ncbi:hypothetical protein FA95DRAFT_615202 [Auriscalpium vulgare]|uniref:Uncharacterized protein n=1 Tax=Auriscalpium vulgare TaxID=40419 RepID=A0ACB8RDM0_9AGAM|nr:hypothetical protein FA95DRAFT_615202 [Auriscalpium vulgare]
MTLSRYCVEELLRVCHKDWWKRVEESPNHGRRLLPDDSLLDPPRRAAVGLCNALHVTKTYRLLMAHRMERDDLQVHDACGWLAVAPVLVETARVPLGERRRVVAGGRRATGKYDGRRPWQLHRNRRALEFEYYQW